MGMYELFIAKELLVLVAEGPGCDCTRSAFLRGELRPFGENDAATAASFRKFSPSGKVPCLTEARSSSGIRLRSRISRRAARKCVAEGVERADLGRSPAAEMHSGFAALRNVCGMNCGVRVRLRETPPALLSDMAVRIATLWNEG